MKYIIKDIYGKYYDKDLNKHVVIVRLASITGEDRNLKKRLFFSDIEEAKSVHTGMVINYTK